MAWSEATTSIEEILRCRVCRDGRQADQRGRRGRLIYVHNGGLFLVSKPIDGKSVCRANDGTICFKTTGPDRADAWHKAGVLRAHIPGQRLGTAKRVGRGSG